MPHASSNTHATSSLPMWRKLKRTWRKIVGILTLILMVYILYDCTSMIIKVFHWAESHVDRDSPVHMLYFFLATLPFNTGIPIPLVHQVWAVAIGVFFHGKAFLILAASLSFGVPVPFMIGRRLARRSAARQFGVGVTVEARLRTLMPKAFSFMTPLRRAIAARPVRSSFLLMWAPLPTSFLPLIIGFLIPSADLPLRAFVAGALPSKLLHFSCDVLIGIEAGSLASALDAHDLDLDNDLEPTSHGHAKLIAFSALAMTVSFMLLMIFTMHQALKEMRAKESSREEGTSLLDDVV